ncbi:Ku protein [Streptomyces shenzhenensis]|uniref:Ku protein n=1 Tax=Streptomyces shenzhenensis TaxID=943815 RepID=UPI0038303AE9
MPASIFNGVVSFGLVSVPITVLSATEDHSVHFRRIHTADGGRVRNRYWCKAEDREVTYGEVGRGYELPDGRGIPVTEEEMRALPLTTAHAVELVALRSSRPPSSTRSASRPRLLLPAGGRRGREAVRAAAPWRHRLTELVPDPNGSCPSHATALLPSSTPSYTDNCSGIAACWCAVTSYMARPVRQAARTVATHSSMKRDRRPAAMGPSPPSSGGGAPPRRGRRSAPFSSLGLDTSWSRARAEAPGG